MVRRKHVTEYIKQKTKERLDASSLTADDVIDELISIGFGRRMKSYSKQTDLESGEVLRNIEYDQSARTEDRLKALEMLGKSMALFTDKLDAKLNQQVIFVEDVPEDDT